MRSVLILRRGGGGGETWCHCLHRRVTKKRTDTALERHPILSTYGYGRPPGSMVTLEQHQRFRSNLEGIEVARVQALVDDLIANYLPTKHPSRAYSYGLKHQMEHRLGYYVSNGEAILAAVVAGYLVRVDPESPNTTFNMSMVDYRAAGVHI